MPSPSSPRPLLRRDVPRATDLPAGPREEAQLPMQWRVHQGLRPRLRLRWEDVHVSPSVALFGADFVYFFLGLFAWFLLGFCTWLSCFFLPFFLFFFYSFSVIWRSSFWLIPPMLFMFSLLSRTVRLFFSFLFILMAYLLKKTFTLIIHHRTRGSKWIKSKHNFFIFHRWSPYPPPLQSLVPAITKSPSVQYYQTIWLLQHCRNDCAMKVESCRSRKSLSIIYRGSCDVGRSMWSAMLLCRLWSAT